MSGGFREKVHRGLALVCGGAAGFAAVPQAHAQSSIELPATVEEFRFLAEPATEDGNVLTLRVDTGGETYFELEAVRRLGISTVSSGDDALLRLARWPAFRVNEWIPPPAEGREGAARVRVRSEPSAAGDADGVLGASWFHARTWTLDYPGRRLLLRPEGDLPLHAPHERVELDLPRDPSGALLPGVPVIRIRVGDETLAVALVADGHARLTEESVAEIGDLRPALRALSRVAAPVFDRWRADHPEWRVLERAEAESGAPLLEIREVEIAGTRLERVWVLRDPSPDPGAGLAAPVSGPVSGILAGDVLREFRVSLDYRSGIAIFEPAGFP